MKSKAILILSLTLSVLTTVAGCIGIFTPNFYAQETLNWQAQSIGQDMINVYFIAPCLMITSILSYKNDKVTPVWAGVIFYLTYTFILYCFDIHFNKLFIIYSFCLGLSFYAGAYFLLDYFQDNNVLKIENNNLIRIIAIYFITLSTCFYLLWLGEIIPSIAQNQIPKSTREAGLFTNGVQVLDLSIVLPGIFIAGIFLLKKKKIGFMLAPAILTFFILMNMTIGTLAVIMKLKAVNDDLTVTAVMSVLTLLSTILLALYFKNTK